MVRDRPRKKIACMVESGNGPLVKEKNSLCCFRIILHHNSKQKQTNMSMIMMIVMMSFIGIRIMVVYETFKIMTPGSIHPTLGLEMKL